MDTHTRKRLVDEHLAAINKLEAQDSDQGTSWPPEGFYLLWHVVIGAMLGTLGAMVSLLANILGAPLLGHRPLELIKVYLTFPMGGRALELDEGVVLFVGCVLYLLTGAIYGVFFHLVIRLFFTEASAKKRFLVATGLALGLWILNFYLILSWLQPLLLGDNWIVRLIPPWVGALTHLTFFWSMFVGETWGRFEPYGDTAGNGGRSAHHG
jgi:hypothetical protein